MTRLRGLGWLAAVAMSTVLSGCGDSKSLSADQYNDPRFRGPGYGSLSDTGGTLFTTARTRPENNDQGGGALGVNAYLWRGALDTLSFMPLFNADPFGGVIITDWYEDPKVKGERYKVNALILDKTLRADGIKVTLFKQKLDDKGVWRDIDVPPHVGRDLEDTILTRARQMRMAQSTK